MINYKRYKRERKYSNSLPITFTQFMCLYKINPNKWRAARYFDTMVEYGEKHSSSQHIAFKTYFDYIKYRFWVIKEKKRREENQKTVITMALCDEWQKDIAQHKVKSEKELTAAAQILLKQSSELTGINEATLALIDKVKEKIK